MKQKLILSIDWIFIVFILPKMSGYVKTFNVKDGDKDKQNKLMSFSV